MQGDTEILQLLNEQLTSELTSINQYFLHSKMQDNWGFTELAAHTRAESFEEMRHAETLTDRILYASSSRATSPSSTRWSSGCGRASRCAGNAGIPPAPSCLRR
jgi:hypothetical protein